MPFYHFALKAPKPLPPNHLKGLKTLRDHIRKKRIEQGVLQKEVAKKIGAHHKTISYWENNITNPSIYWIPRIIDFLGYAPYSPPKSFGERLSKHRKFLSLTQKQLAKTMGIHPTTIRDWENGMHRPMKRSLVIIEDLFKHNI